ncbi:MAG: hypothetical protein R3B40_18330 [Polyangiales bacterium]|nr:hypothetical protein [Myxococcales bacterium]MCB9658498.1 hypothetical protein [Sandaracinaceae bacterium]
MQDRFDTDTSQYPFVLVTIPSQRVPDEEVLRFIEGQRQMLARRSKHLMLCDARNGHAMPATQRKLFGDWLKESQASSGRYTAGMAIVVDNALIRGALTAVLWLVEPACPTKAVGTVEEGFAYLTECGERAGMSGVRELLDAARRVRRSA